MARSTAKFSKDAETKVGCLILDPEDYSVLATGYNSFVKGAPDGTLPNTRPEKYKFILHAETSAICNAARNGSRLHGGIVVQTLSPCVHCARMLFQCGIRTVYFDEKYRDFQESLDMKDIRIKCKKYAGFYKMTMQKGSGIVDKIKRKVL